MPGKPSTLSCSCDTSNPWSVSLPGLAIGGIIFLATIAFLSSSAFTGLDESNTPGVFFALFLDGTWAAAWIASAVGTGILVHRLLYRKTKSIDMFSIATGVAMLLWIDHLLGCCGILQLAGGVMAYLVLVPGLIGCFVPLIHREAVDQETCGRTLATSLIADWYLIPLGIIAAIYVAAAASAPGYLWDSEFGGFDALSYHLQLIREWLAAGRIVPLQHNVYSFLPSYVESAYYHLAVLRDPFRGRFADGAQAAALSCQYLHVAISFLAFLAIAELIRDWPKGSRGECEKNHFASPRSVSAKALGLAALALPWCVVVGTLAYNEMATILFFAAALSRVATTHSSNVLDEPAISLGPVDCLLIGFMLGVACGAKLTALGLVVIPVMLVFTILRGRSIGAIAHLLMVSLGGFVALAPYAIRNYIATDFGNPFFPFASSVLGRVHWTTEQVTRFTAGHLPNVGGSGARLARLWEMAFMHTQWSGWWFIAITCGLVALILKDARRRAGLAFVILIAGVIFWLFGTHMQSRFLLPAVIPLVLLMASLLTTTSLLSVVIARRAANTIAIAFLVVTLGFTFATWSTQRGGHPARLIDGLPIFTGAGLNENDRRFIGSQNPTVWINTNLRDASGAVYLLGDSTPFYLDLPYVYNTTWDASPLGNVIREFGEHPDEWVGALRARDIQYVLINWGELERLIVRDHWYDPDVTIDRVREFRSSSRARLVMQWLAGEKQIVTQELIELR